MTLWNLIPRKLVKSVIFTQQVIITFQKEVHSTFIKNKLKFKQWKYDCIYSRSIEGINNLTWSSKYNEIFWSHKGISPCHINEKIWCCQVVFRVWIITTPKKGILFWKLIFNNQFFLEHGTYFIIWPLLNIALQCSD